MAWYRLKETSYIGERLCPAGSVVEITAEHKPSEHMVPCKAPKADGDDEKPSQAKS